MANSPDNRPWIQGRFFVYGGKMEKLTEKNFKQIPEFLRGFHNWVNWALVERDGKLTKIPIDPKTGKPAKTTDPSTWGTLEEAKKKYLECENGYIQGVGFVFTKTPLTGIDLDHCRNPETGEINPRLMEIVDLFRSYTEITPSSTGLHIIIYGKLPNGVTGRRKDGIEIYSQDRFFTITGNLLPGAYAEIKDRQKILDEFYQEHFIKGDGSTVDKPKEPPTVSITLSDEEVLVRARQGKDGEQFEKLFKGDWTGYASPSDADWALNRILAGVTQNKEQIDRLFRQSLLIREKWDSRRGGSTYGANTIQKAILATPLEPQIISPREEKEFLTLKDLRTLEHNKAEYVWEEILIDDGTGMLVAKPRVGKTTLSYNLAHCVALGKPFLNRQTKQGKVLYLALEDSKKQVTEITFNWEDTEENILFRFGCPSDDPIEDLEKWITEFKPSLVIIDTLQKFLRIKDLNDYAQVTTALQPIMDLARKYNCHILMTHHAKKQDTNPEDSILGSIGLQGGVDTTIHLKKYDSYRTFSTIQRYGEDIPETTIELGADSTLTIGLDKQEAEVQEAYQGVIKALAGGSKNLTEIAEFTEKRKQIVLEALKILMARGKVDREGKGKRNDPYVYTLRG